MKIECPHCHEVFSVDSDEMRNFSNRTERHFVTNPDTEKPKERKTDE